MLRLCFLGQVVNLPAELFDPLLHDAQLFFESSRALGIVGVNVAAQKAGSRAGRQRYQQWLVHFDVKHIVVLMKRVC